MVKNINITSLTTKLYLITVLFFCFSLSGIAQDGSVIIAESGITVVPHNSVMLEVFSNKKGILFPRMSFEAMRNIEAPSDGLIVFVMDHEFKGYWFYNATDNKWIQLRESGSEKLDVTGPTGTIIMYCGEINSTLFNSSGEGIGELSGWNICNGENGTPDLRGRFIMSATYSSSDSDKQVGYYSTEATGSLQLSVEQMHPHTHEFTNPNGELEPHDHKVIELPHTHEIAVNNSGRGKRYKEIMNRVHGGLHIKYTDPSTVPFSEYVTIDPANESIAINYGVDVQSTGEGKSIENRPPYYVMVYLIKL